MSLDFMFSSELTKQISMRISDIIFEIQNIFNSLKIKIKPKDKESVDKSFDRLTEIRTELDVFTGVKH